MNRVALFVYLVVCLVPAVNAQKKTTSALCSRENAVDTTKQQILDTRTFNNPVQRIAVLLRAADLLWPHEQDTAMAAFMEAFDLAVQDFKELGDQIAQVPKNQFTTLTSLPDLRFKVISALGKRDPVTAQKLSAKILQDDVQDSAADHPSKQRTAEKILNVAFSLAATDATSAVNFARQSLRYPATVALPTFFYELAKTNQPGTDQFYAEALAAYGAAPMNQFLFLSSYPFGNTREVGEMGVHKFYQVPEGFVPNRALQRQFMRALLMRIEGAMEQPVAIHVNGRPFSDHTQMCLALNRLEKQLQSELPDLFNTAMQAKDKLYALLDPNAQSLVRGMSRSYNAAPRNFFEQMIAGMAMNPEGKYRDQSLTMVIISELRNQPVEKLANAIDKISDDTLRASLLNLAYHFGTQSLIAEKKLTEARKLVGNVAELDHRAYLISLIAEESLKRSGDQTEARDLLNDVADVVNKAPKTTVSARAVFAMAYLYAQVDTNRGIEELANAVKTINSLESPNFSQQFVRMKIQGPRHASYVHFDTTSFEPETTFREMSKLDFDGSLTQATSINDKNLRALTTLSIIEPCFATKSTKKTK